MADVTSMDTLASTRLVLMSSVNDLATIVSTILVTNIAEARLSDTTSCPRRLVFAPVTDLRVRLRVTRPTP